MEKGVCSTRANVSIDPWRWECEVDFFFFEEYCSIKAAEDILVPPLWENRANMFVCFSPFFFSSGCRRRSFFFFVANCQDGGWNQLVWRQTLDLEIDSTHGRPAWCQARPTGVDDRLEYIRWIHGLGGESLPVAPYGRLPNLFFYFVCCHSRRIEKFCHLFCAHQRPIVFSSYTRPAPATCHRPLCEHGGSTRRVGRSP